jgi:hypothetical protein
MRVTHLQKRNSDQEGTRKKEDVNSRWGMIIENMGDRNVVGKSQSADGIPGNSSIDNKRFGGIF